MLCELEICAFKFLIVRANSNALSKLHKPYCMHLQIFLLKMYYIENTRDTNGPATAFLDHILAKSTRKLSHHPGY